MKKLTLFLSVFALATMGIAQQFQSSGDQPAPMGTSPVQLKGGTEAMCDTNISYSEAYVSAIGFGGAATWQGGIYFDTVQTQFFGDTVWMEAVQVFIADTAVISGIVISIYEGSAISGETFGNTLTNGSLLYTKNISNAQLLDDAMTTILLDSALLVDNTIGYSVMVTINQTAQGFPLGVSAGPIELGRGGWISNAGSYIQLPEANSALDYNWLINVCVEGDIIIPQHNIQLASAIYNPTGYEQLPYDHIKPAGYSFEVELTNIGVDTATGVFSYVKVDTTVVDTMMHGVMIPGAFNTQNSILVQLDTVMGVHNVSFNSEMDSTDFNPFDNDGYGSYFISDSIYSRTSKSTYFITGDFLAGNAYDFEATTYIKRANVSVYNDDQYFIPGQSPLYVALFAVNTGNGQVDPIPLAVSDTIFSPDSFELAENQNKAYNFEFNFPMPLGVVQGQRILAAYNNVVAGIRRYDEPPVYQNNTSFSGGSVAPNGNYTFSPAPGSYYRVDLVLDRDFVPPPVIDNLNELRATFGMYPNPAGRELTIDGAQNSIVTITDVAGRVLQSHMIRKDRTTISLEGLTSGTYFVTATGEDVRATEKLIIE